MQTDRTRWQNAAALYLTLQGTGALVWWTVLIVHPAIRRYFLPVGYPDAALMAFGVGDGLLFVGLSFGCAWGLRHGRSWAWPLLCVHAGAAVYASLYCVTLTALTRGQALWGAALMLPALIVPSYLVYKLRPGEQP